MVNGDVIPPLDAAVEALERDLIMRAMFQAGNVVSNAAKLLSIKRTTLIAKMKKLGLKGLKNGSGRGRDDFSFFLSFFLS